MKCALCNKIATFGNKVSHSKRHTRRRWLPNIHPSTIIVNGQSKRVKICTRCLRSQHKTKATKTVTL